MTDPPIVIVASGRSAPIDLSGAELRPDNPYLEAFRDPLLRVLRWVDGEDHPRVVGFGSDEPGESLCLCDGYRHWYATDDGIQVCWCGHPASEHLDRVGSCTGVVEILPAEQP